MIPVNQPLIAKNALKYVSDCIKTGWISSAGSYITKFEEAFAKFIGVKYAITTTNGTTALHLALATLGTGPGDEVIVPDHTMFACADAICYTGAKPVVVDVERDTWNIDVKKIERKITKHTKVIIPVHIYGHPVDMDPLISLAKKYKLAVVEDAAEAHGALYKGKMVGSFGKINCFSFYANKIVTTGEGGMVVTDDEKLATRARMLKDLAHSPKRRFLHEEIAFNYRLTNLQAALGLAQLEEVDKFIEKKLWMADLYNRLLSDIEGISLPPKKPWARNVYWMYSILIEPSFGISRDELMDKLKKKGIDTRTFFIPLHCQPALRKYHLGNERFPVSDEISRRGLYLPSGLAITKKQIEMVSYAIHEITRRRHRR
ncbi:aminotransferase DegT [Candidatus Gottesmanbacteria bacterium RIFCSPLOWO2_01_FULL_43_11b]|uniref:Aminotransferase DegT n=1 Tax=Candidatus Gottesmanbacteria bacterium RIFCSPLOWO2_01_FULL_43_11b TaxID=1798392 RepID=A0A1F6AID3_9BACT|nr:MAG: aminotransferase DegT [Candidatus Gottesmanbacteria bacterium RIFCSPLOWO2_01_FULL_43_11b]